MFLETPAVRMHFDRRGTGPNVLFVNGTGSDLRNLPNCFDLPLANTLNMCAYDHRGLGQSTPTDPTHQQTMAEMAADAIAVVDRTAIRVGVGLLGSLVKEVVQRQRPTPALVNVFSPLSDYSFPSGHVLFFTAFLGFLFFLLYTLTPHSTLRTLGLVIMGALIGLVGVSRVYLGQHWPSDVLGAYLMGSVWLALMIYLYRWGKPRFFVHAHGENQ